MANDKLENSLLHMALLSWKAGDITMIELKKERFWYPMASDELDEIKKILQPFDYQYSAPDGRLSLLHNLL